MTRYRPRWTCSDGCHVEHRYLWTAWLHTFWRRTWAWSGWDVFRWID